MVYKIKKALKGVRFQGFGLTFSVFLGEILRGPKCQKNIHTLSFPQFQRKNMFSNIGTFPRKCLNLLKNKRFNLLTI